MKRLAVKIYQSKAHLIFTLLVVVAPFFYLLLFSRLANIASATLFLDVWASFWRLITAYIIAVIFAWISAVLFYRGRRAAIALPIFDVLQSFPTFAALPLAAFFWGPSNSTVIFFLIITVVWPNIFLNNKFAKSHKARLA